MNVGLGLRNCDISLQTISVFKVSAIKSSNQQVLTEHLLGWPVLCPLNEKGLKFLDKVVKVNQEFQSAALRSLWDSQGGSGFKKQSTAMVYFFLITARDATYKI